MSDAAFKMDRPVPEAPAYPSFVEAFQVWLKIGLLSFGGPAGQIALMHRILVEEKRWISDARFLHALNYCMLLPGPEAQQLATYVGWLLHGIRGGILAGLLFILPGFVVILGLSIVYALFQGSHILDGLFFGLKAAVLVIVLQAVIRLGNRALKNRVLMLIAATSFLAIFVFQVPFPLIVLGAAILGFLGTRLRPDLFQSSGHRAAQGSERPVLALTEPKVAPGWRHPAGTILVWGAVWAAPILLLAGALGRDNVFMPLASFFSQMAVVTFGGAYAVLAYVAQEAVSGFGWLQPGEMLDGLAMAETTPGPLLLVLSFVGFLAAFRAPPGIDPFLSGLIGATLVTWVTFVPSFLWIFLGAPYMERLRSNRVLSGALTAVTAAVVGVILNLALWFGLHVLFRDTALLSLGPLRMTVPVLGSFEPWAAMLVLVAAIALFRFRLGIFPVLAISAGLGLLLRFLA